MRTVPRKRIKHEFERKLYVILKTPIFRGGAVPNTLGLTIAANKSESQEIESLRLQIRRIQSHKSTRRNQSGRRALDDVEDCDDKGDDNPDKEDNNGEEDNDDDRGRVVYFANVGKHNC